jgi:hypothetical protein
MIAATVNPDGTLWALFRVVHIVLHAFLLPPPQPVDNLLTLLLARDLP